MQKRRGMVALVFVLAGVFGFSGPISAQGGDTLPDVIMALMDAGWSLEQTSETEWELSDGERVITITLSEELPTTSEETEEPEEAEEPEETIETLPASDRFNVVPTSNVNLRECASTTCALVGSASAGQVIEVLAIDTDEQGQEWYQFENSDGVRAFIASWLTKRGPDVRLTQQEFEDGYVDLNTDCVLVMRVNRGRSDMALAITGSGYDEAFVDLYRPNETYPLNVFGQYPKTFIDTGDLYIHQIYNAGFPAGIYTLELTGANGNTSVIEFEYQTTGDTLIYAYCE